MGLFTRANMTWDVIGVALAAAAAEVTVRGTAGETAGVKGGST